MFNKFLFIFIIIFIFSISPLYGAAFKIPETSFRSVGLSGACIANPDSADTNYYNPALLSFMDNKGRWESGIINFKIPEINFSGNTKVSPTLTIPSTGKAASEAIMVPYFHYVAPENGKFRYGFSMITPAGLTSRWYQNPQQWFSQEFTLKIMEINPAFSRKITDRLSLGGGLRFFKATGRVILNNPTPGVGYNLNLEGTTRRNGYNLALAYKLSRKSMIGITYRSKTDLRLHGNSSGNLKSIPLTFSTDIVTTIPIPSSLDIGISFREGKNIWEFDYEKNYWSSFSELNFDFSNPIVEAAFGKNIPKNWKDSNTFRLGFTRNINRRLQFLTGMAIDKTPVPVSTLGYELPDGNSKIYSVGLKYKFKNDFEFGISYLTSIKDNIDIPLGTNIKGISGVFSNNRVNLTNLTLRYSF